MPPRHSEEHGNTPQPARAPRRRRAPARREDQVRRQVPSRNDSAAEDRVTRTGFTGETAAAAVTPTRQASPLVLPGLRHIAVLAAPDAIATVSLLLAFATVAVMGEFSPLFVAPLIVPSIILAVLNVSTLGQGWRAAASVNLATMLVLFPFLVIRQSTVRVPYLDAAHGTVYAAVMSTIMVLIALAGVAIYAAWASRQDPESAPTLFLPAAMMVPLLTSATEFGQLDSALLVAGLIFASATCLTLIASMLPPAYTVFVAPVAVAIEVLFVTLVQQQRIFPVGVGEAGMALFAAVIVASIGLVVMLPAISTWFRHVDVLRIRHPRPA